MLYCSAILALLCGLLCVAPLIAAPACNQSLEKPTTYLHLPGRPFEPVPTADGCWIFVSMMGGPNRSTPGIGVIERSGGKANLKRVFPIAAMLSGMALTHDGSLLIAGTGNGILFLSVPTLISLEGDPVLGRIQTTNQKPSGSYISITSDDRFAFVSNESAGSISVINLGSARQTNYSSNAIVGTIPVGRAPIAVTLSPDDHYLYSTSELAPVSYGWPNTCRAEQPSSSAAPINRPPGALVVVNVSRAEQDPAHSIIAKSAAGCSPVRLVLSPYGERAYVTARSDNALLIFDTRKLISDTPHARIASIPVGNAPVGVAAIEQGLKIVVANSNRFSDNGKNQNLSVIDANNKLMGVIPAQLFPRELRLTPDDRTLLVTNFTSKTLEFVDLAQSPIQVVK